MKILVARPSGGAYLYIARGFINAFNAIGCHAKFWDGDEKTWTDTKPDLYIGCSGHRKIIPQNRGNVKVAIHVNPYGTRLEPLHGVDINEPKEAINWTLSQKPDVVFGYGHQDDASTFWSNWSKNHNIKFIGVPTAADHTLYYSLEIEKKVNNIVYLGGRWPYKANKIDQWLLPLTKVTNIKIMGWGGWQGVNGYTGVIPDSDSGREFLASGKVGPCMCEPHTTKFGIDIPERFFKVALCKTLPVVDFIPNFNRYYESDTFLMARDPNEYVDLVCNYANNPAFEKARIELTESIFKQTRLNHTYMNRMRDLCAGLEVQELVEKFDSKIKEINN
jgi:hypothetical protein